MRDIDLWTCACQRPAEQYMFNSPPTFVLVAQVVFILEHG